MGLVSGIVTFLCIWWTVLFCTLPIGVEAQGVNAAGALPGAPKNPHLKFKMLLTTGISLILWGIVYILIQMELINFHEIATQMSAADRD